MANNKNQLLRYKILHKCFRNPKRKYFINDLISECNKAIIANDPNPDAKGISRRSIFNDIAFMESEKGWSIDLDKLKEGKETYYRYTDTNFSISNMPLNELELQQLKESMAILSNFKGMPQFEGMDEILTKLNADALLEQEAFISFESSEFLKGKEYLGQLYEAIKSKTVLNITYKPFTESAQQIELHPYYLKQYNGRWFLFGFNPIANKPNWNMPLDRIENIKPNRKRHIKNTSIDWVDYFDEIIGVTLLDKAKKEKIILHFIGITGHYIESNPINASQKSNWLDEQTLEVKLELYINYELERLLLSYTGSVKIISPNHLNEKIKEKLKLGLGE